MYKLIIVGILLLCLTGCCCCILPPPDDNVSGNTNTETTPGVTKPKPKLKLVSYTNETGEFGNRFITGVVRNDSGRNYSYVSITFDMFDADGNKVGSAWDNISGLEKNKTWKFKAIVLEDDAANYKLSDLSGY